tara:strand:+ start:1780 stop:2940 length:1161 start_codon:yes stop_codon:yes gene_type:complete
MGVENYPNAELEWQNHKLNFRLKKRNTMASREMRLLNRRRWDAHIAAREAQGIPLEHTGGALFNRSNPIGPNGNFQDPYVRTNDAGNRYIQKRGKLVFVDRSGRPQPGPDDEERRIELMKEWQKPGSAYVPVYGYDFTSVHVASHRKYRIPNTSVVNKVGDLRLICCCNMRLTAVRNAPLPPPVSSAPTDQSRFLQAQWIWWLNLLCFLVHTTMVFVTLYLAYWRWDRSMWRDTDHVMVKIYRVTQVPTAAMIASNESKWSTGWNNRSIGGGNKFYLVDNSTEVNFATLTLSFFAISAVFHLWACVVGLFERFWYATSLSFPNETTRTHQVAMLLFAGSSIGGTYVEFQPNMPCSLIPKPAHIVFSQNPNQTQTPKKNHPRFRRVC